EFVSKTEYDALNRATNLLTPHNAAIPASEIMPAYDEGGLLKSVNAKLRGATEETDFVEKISYNPKGQRTRIRYGNGATTKYTYDEKTFRLTQLFTTRENGTNVLQDLNYTYDPVGNITEIRDDAQDVVFFDNQIVNPSQKFEYDALYRLIKVTGREHAGNEADTDFENDGYPNAHTSIPNDTAALRRYTREWEYDEVGNILEMIHTANNSNWNRMYSYASSNNRLNSTAVGQTTVNYTYNSHGSMASMPHLQAMEWDFAERLRHITKGTTEAYYNYDGSGERVRKVVEKNGVIETRLYLGGFEIFRKRNGNVLELERETLHVMDSFEYNELEENEKDNEAIEIKNNASRITKNKRRIAIVETKTWENNIQVANPILVQRYQLSNNIESVTLELNESADIISYEEYYPYGDTSYQAGTSEVSKKRYRYTGKEKDEESGLYYFHARYYSSMIGIFISVDPKFEKYPNVSSYAYCMNNPVKYIDPDGKEIKLEGTAAEQEAILSNLQKLTNDKLGMRSNDDGTSTVIIKKIGGERTKKYLKLGSELIRDLNKKGDGAKIVTIKIGTNESWAYPADTNEDRANAENGIGGNAIIEFDMTTVVDVLTTNSGFSSEIKTVSREKMPNKINLAHELIHASNINKGVVGSFEKKLHGYRTNRGVRFEMVSIDELYTMGIENSINPSVSKYAGRRFTENKIRKEHGLNLRVAYK
ncbi:MAG: hypothetical protein LBC85_02325, partial [Fibromonadaceae bacterium]|nr:hypothetical protein [Fibromonadaceae bacterium]